MYAIIHIYIFTYKDIKMNENKPFSEKIKPFNFILIGSERSGIIPGSPMIKILEILK